MEAVQKLASQIQKKPPPTPPRSLPALMRQNRLPGDYTKKQRAMTEGGGTRCRDKCSENIVKVKSSAGSIKSQAFIEMEEMEMKK